ncbi:hypothetical protein NDU88_008289 [Pleurodeles waltl]|uniref:Uncharacterized protein n=1 Tax=Pleurodeles waltl TaxID=8319 RepID=A0AAV7N997_PLEWA|nr:hypothetical protein NDU88_008289 [Pleurodeles waltl]
MGRNEGGSERGLDLGDIGKALEEALSTREKELLILERSLTVGNAEVAQKNAQRQKMVEIRNANGTLTHTQQAINNTLATHLRGVYAEEQGAVDNQGNTHILEGNYFPVSDPRELQDPSGPGKQNGAPGGDTDSETS